MHEICKQIGAIQLVPVIKLTDENQAVPLGKALKNGGIPVAEITFRTQCAAAAIGRMAKQLPDVLVGAGTVITIEQVQQAVAAGAKFIISPGFDPVVVEYCLAHNIPIIPGCSNASDLCQAVRLGLETVKFFPAEAAGGIHTLKAFFAPFASLHFIPTGGINETNVADYLTYKQVLACGGSWMAPEKLIQAADWDGITAVARKALAGISTR